MSTKYKHGDHVPTSVLAKRLDELSDVIGQPGEERDRELTRRIPAELDRDADLVLSEAAQRLLKVEAERDALAAHVERLEDIIERSTLADSPAAESALEDTPATSLAHLKAHWQAEALETVASISDYEGKPWGAERLRRHAGVMRRQAEAKEPTP